MVNWFTWPWSLLNTKFTLILYPHILKISLRLSNYGSRYSLADNQRSNSEITHPHCLAFMREKIDASSVLSLNNLIKINTWILTWCRNQTKKKYFWRQRNLVSHYHWCHHPGPKHLIVWNHNQWRVNFEFDRCSPARLYLKPHSMDRYEIFRICKWNIKVNLIFSKFYDYANRFIVKDTPKVSENIWLSLY